MLRTFIYLTNLPTDIAEKRIKEGEIILKENTDENKIWILNKEVEEISAWAIQEKCKQKAKGA